MYNVFFYLLAVVNGLLLVHVLQELLLLIQSFRPRSKITVPPLRIYPKVTIQLPLYNEKYVVIRLLEAMQRLEYPKEQLEIQILDDSNDETSALISEFIQNLGKEDFEFLHIQRENRVGYKAGALQEGLERCKGEFIAIFDADFVPNPDFLLQTLPHFVNDQIGLVQTRWLHLNEEHSLLTRAQAIMLNTHFGVEQLGRSKAKGFINFNGTAGVWRKQCIEDADGWQGDTLTEDLDLSFRAQAKGWEFEFLFDVGTPAELPVTFEAFRTQQFRWSKGAAECLRKNFSILWNSQANVAAKVFGTFHLMNSSVYLLVVAILFLSPMVFYFNQKGWIDVAYKAELMLLGGSTVYLLLFIFLVGSMRASVNKLKALVFFLPSVLTFFAMTTGISLFVVLGVIDGYLGKPSSFVRTPKFGTNGVLNRVKKGYDFKSEYKIYALELPCLLYGIFWVVSGAYQFNLISILYGGIILIGFSLSLFFKKRTFRWSS